MLLVINLLNFTRAHRQTLLLLNWLGAGGILLALGLTGITYTLDLVFKDIVAHEGIESWLHTMYESSPVQGKSMLMTTVFGLGMSYFVMIILNHPHQLTDLFTNGPDWPYLFPQAWTVIRGELYPFFYNIITFNWVELMRTAPIRELYGFWDETLPWLMASIYLEFAPIWYGTYGIPIPLNWLIGHDVLIQTSGSGLAVILLLLAFGFTSSNIG